MIRVLRSFAYYPAHVIGVVLLVLGYVASWFCFLSVLLFGVLMLAGEFPERWGVVAGLGITGAVIRLLMEVTVRVLAVLSPEWVRR